jgi:hypothetical protein
VSARPLVGLLVNPMAGRDIRRLVARAHMASGPEKLMTLQRVAAGVSAGGAHVLVGDDVEGIGRTLAESASWVTVLDPPAVDAETRDFVPAFERAGVAVLITVGGDGTQRQVALARPRIPVLPVAGGTNNVSCWTGDETAAGLAAALVATGAARAGRRSKVIHVRVGDREDLALVDVALVRQPFVGALAVWEADDLDALLLTVADPVRPGLSNVGGQILPVAAEDETALALQLGASGTRVPAVLAPGLVSRIAVAAVRRVALGESLQWTVRQPSTLALDGERTLMVSAGMTVTLTVRRDGPRILDPSAVLRATPFHVLEKG